MMEQQEQQMITVAEKEAGGALRRIVLSLTVAAMMTLGAADLALAKDNFNQSTSGNVHETNQSHPDQSEPADGGGALVEHDVSYEGPNRVTDQDVVTPSGNVLSQLHQKKAK